MMAHEAFHEVADKLMAMFGWTEIDIDEVPCMMEALYYEKNADYIDSLP